MHQYLVGNSHYYEQPKASYTRQENRHWETEVDRRISQSISKIREDSEDSEYSEGTRTTETNGTIKKDEQEEMWYKQNKLI